MKSVTTNITKGTKKRLKQGGVLLHHFNLVAGNLKKHNREDAKVAKKELKTRWGLGAVAFVFALA